VTFVSAVNAKNGMRINGASGQGIFDGVIGTTILRNINTTAGTAQMFNALTGVAVNATITVGSIAVTLNNSGAAGGSHDTDAFQNITGQFDLRPTTSIPNPILNDLSGAFTGTTSGGTGSASGLSASGSANDDQLLEFDASDSPSARTHDQTQPISSAVKYFYKV